MNVIWCMTSHVWRPSAVQSSSWHPGSSFQDRPRPPHCSPWCSAFCGRCLWRPDGPPSAGPYISPTCHSPEISGPINQSGEEQRREESSSRPDNVVIGLSLLSQVDGQTLHLLNGVFSHRHVALCITGGFALQDTNNFMVISKLAPAERRRNLTHK